MVEATVKERWFELTEAGGGGIEGARAYNEKAQNFWRQPAFWVSMSMLPLLYGTVWIVLTSADGFSGELKAAIATAVVTGILSGVLGFWLGSSFTTSRSKGMGATPS